MSKKVTTEDFIKQSKEIHGDKYSYSKTIYTKAKDFLIITCPIHGDFLQRARVHITNKSGCPNCVKKKDIWSKDEFIKELENRCGTLPYIVIGEYTGTQNKVLTQNEFGICLSIANNLLKKVVPGIETAINKIEYWTNQVKQIHGDNYDYSKVDFKNSNSEVNIICKKHGEFKQVARSHLSGAGCPMCSFEYRCENPIFWNHTSWQKAGQKSKNFYSFKVYILKCWNDEEEFYKIGKTYLKISRRFQSKKSLPYNYKILKELSFENAINISELEWSLKNCNKRNKYLPKKEFGGRYECFKELDLSCFEEYNLKTEN